MAAKKELIDLRIKKYEEEKSNAKPGDILTLDFSGIDSRFIPFIPEGVTRLNFADNKIKSLKVIPYFLTYVNFSSNYIENLPSLPDRLETIILTKNNLTELPFLPKNLKFLQVGENKLKNLPTLPKKLEYLDVNSNNLKSLPDMPNTLTYVNASFNKIKSLGKLSTNLSILNLKMNELTNSSLSLEIFPDSITNLDLSYNKFTEIPIISDYTKIKISNNPVSINLRKLQPKNISSHSFINETGENEEYKTIKIPKGTVLFHSAKRLEQFAELFVGYIYKNKTVSEYRLHPQHLSYFYLSPSFQKSEYGANEGLFILNQDVEVVLGLLPSKDTKRQIENNYQENCKNLDYDTIVEQRYDCFKRNFPVKTGFLTQGYRNFKTEKELQPYNYFYSYFEDFEGNINVPEFVIHPRKERIEKDLILPKSDFSYEWLNSNIDKYIFKPFFIFEDNETLSYNDKLEAYLSKLRQLLSPSGFTDSSGSYHMTIHKEEGFYMIAEYTDSEVLKECLSVNDSKKEEFLKKVKVF